MGAGDIYVCATHGIFSGPAIEDVYKRQRLQLVELPL